MNKDSIFIYALYQKDIISKVNPSNNYSHNKKSSYYHNQITLPINAIKRILKFTENICIYIILIYLEILNICKI